MIPCLADEGCSAGTLAPLHQCLSATQMFRLIPSNGWGQKFNSGCRSRVRRYQGVSDLGQVDELLVGGGAHVEADGQHLFQSSHDERRLHWVSISPFLLLGSLGIRASALRGDTTHQRAFTESPKVPATSHWELCFLWQQCFFHTVLLLSDRSSRFKGGKTATQRQFICFSSVCKHVSYQ